MTKQRIYALLLTLGASFLLYRTIALMAEGILKWATWWVSVLLFIELLIDLGCVISLIWWFATNDPSKDRIPLRMGTAVVLSHALRVLVFALGRTGPWVNFDVKPGYIAWYDSRWSWGEVYFASVMALLSIIVVIIIWRIRIRNRKNDS
jgi:hypothetical protein